VVRVPFPQEDGSLTPYTFELGYQLMTLAYDTLMWRDREGVAKPWLARSVEPNQDATRITVRLAEGARWQDGPPVTADDVAFTFGFVASHPHPRFTAEVAAVKRVEVVNPSTAVITLRHPSPGFLDQPLADLPILPAHLWRNLPPGKLAPEGLPVGSGPYRLVEHRPGEFYRFEANSDYFRGRPGVDTLEVPIIGDAEQRLRAIEQGRVDMIPLPLTQDAGERVEGIATRLMTGPSFQGTVLMFNLRKPPFDRPAVRQAVAQALNLDRMVKVAGGGVAARNGYLHPESRWASSKALPLIDEAAAGAALADLHLEPVEILAPENDAARLAAGRQVALVLRLAGVEASARAVPAAELSRAVGEDGTPPAFTAAIWGTPSLASDDPDFLRRVFGSQPATAALNYSGYSSPAFDALMDRIETTSDSTLRHAAVDDALRLLSTDLPVVPLFFSTGTYAYRPAAYRGWVFVKGTGIFDKRSFVEPAESPPDIIPDPTPDPVKVRPRPSSRYPIRLVAVGAGGLLVVAIAAGALRRKRRRPR